MSKKSFQSNFTKFMSGKGFYLALAICLIGTGTAAWVAVDRTLGSIDQNNTNLLNSLSSSQEDKSWGFPTTEEAGKEQEGISLSSTPSSSSSTPSSSSEQSVNQPQSSEPLTQPQTPSISAFVLPIDGEIFANYSGGKLVKDPTLNEWKTHNGIDIKAAKGTAVFCVAEGTVSNIYNDPMWGHTIEISHAQGLTSIYCGLAKEMMVKKGDPVKIGQQIGTVDTVPAEISLQEHLHFGMKCDGKWVDPLVAMNKVK